MNLINRLLNRAAPAAQDIPPEREGAPVVSNGVPPGATQLVELDAYGRAEPVISNMMVGSSDSMLAMFAPVSDSGVPVTADTAMRVSTVYACVSKLAGTISQLPIFEYVDDKGGVRERVGKNGLFWLLNESPHAIWTATSWKEWIMRCVAMRGDQHTEIIRRGTEPVALLPHHPDCVQVVRVGDRLRYYVWDVEQNRARGVDQDDMLHFSGFGFNGLRSMSMIEYAAHSAIGNALAAAKFTGKTMTEGGMPQIALKYPNKLSPDQADTLRDSFTKTYGMGQGRKLPLVMTEGGEVQVLSIAPVDLELMEQRQFEKEEICQAFGVPGILIGDNTKTSSWGTGIEQITLGFVKFTIKPHLGRWEEELNRKLFRRAGKFLEFYLDELQAGDSKTQGEVFRQALGGPGTGDGWMTVNEVRRIKNLPPVEGGDEIYRAQRDAATQPSTEGEKQ